MAASPHKCPKFGISLDFLASFWHTDEETSTFRVPFSKKSIEPKLAEKSGFPRRLDIHDIPLMSGS